MKRRACCGKMSKYAEKRWRSAIWTLLHLFILPSINKGRHGFDGQKCPYTASSPLRIRQYSLRVFPCLVTFLLRQNCKAPASDEFTSDFWLLRRRRAGARQDEKGKKRRKDTLAGVFALVNRWYNRFCPSAALGDRQGGYLTPKGTFRCVSPV